MVLGESSFYCWVGRCSSKCLHYALVVTNYEPLVASYSFPRQILLSAILLHLLLSLVQLNDASILTLHCSLVVGNCR